MIRNLLFIFLISMVVTAESQQSQSPNEPVKKIKLDARRPVRLDYKSQAWNKDPLKVETSAILVRDSHTGRLAKIVVTETGANTGMFVGYYQLSFDTSSGTAAAEMTPEIYIVNQEMLKSNESLKNIDVMIREGTVLRKPFFFRTEGSIQALSIYDSKAQAVQAYEEFLKTGTGRPLIDRATLEAQRLAQMDEEKRRLAEQQAKAEAERKRIEMDEAAKADERRRKQQALDEAERNRRKKSAGEQAEKAMGLYRLDRYAEAENHFQKAVELDPENQSYYFQYGVTLYKTQKYQKSVAILNLAKEGKFDPVERDYYIALNYVKLKENTSAYKAFLDIKNKNNQVISPAAGFFAAVIDFQNENYDAAKILFEYVLDSSQDPLLDQQAESYIEQIANVKQFQELQKKKFLITANMGLMYDTNVLGQDASQTNLDLQGYRFNYGGSVEYRAIFTPTKEFSANLSVSNMKSLSRQFQESADLRKADPLTGGFFLPFVYKTSISETPYRVSISPGFETILMNLDDEGSSEPIVNSGVVKLDQTFVFTPKWFSALNLEYRSDQSFIPISSDDENSSGTRFTVNTSQTLFDAEKKDTAWTIDLGYAANTAKGVNQTFNKMDLAVGYFTPLSDKYTGTARISYYNSIFPKHTSERKDTNFGFSLGTRSPITEVLSWSSTLSYNKNTSNLTGFSYDKWVAMAVLSWAQNF